MFPLQATHWCFKNKNKNVVFTSVPDKPDVGYAWRKKKMRPRQQARHGLFVF